jgi:predicted enzyme related to lactoylglutathione lyase
MSKMVHFEIPVDDADRATAFYRSVLAWEISGYGGMPYWLVQAGPADEPGADGALIARGDIHRNPVVIAGVDDLDAALARVEQEGGKVLQGKLPVPGVGWSAYVTDTEGNTIGLFEADASAGDSAGA